MLPRIRGKRKIGNALSAKTWDMRRVCYGQRGRLEAALDRALDFEIRRKNYFVTPVAGIAAIQSPYRCTPMHGTRLGATGE